MATAKKSTEPKAKSEDKPKRKVLTAEERIEKARADLAKLEAKQGERNVKALVTLYVQRKKVDDKVNDLTKQRDEIDERISELEAKTDADQVKAAKEQHDAEVEVADAEDAQREELQGAAHDASQFVKSASMQAHADS